MSELYYTLKGTGANALKTVGGVIVVLGVIGGFASVIMGIGNLDSYRGDEVLGLTQLSSGIIGIFLSILIKVLCNSISNINVNTHKLAVMKEYELKKMDVELVELGGDDGRYGGVK